MTDQFSRDRSEKLVKFYEAYRTLLDATPVDGRFIEYRWRTLPNPLNAAWMAYSHMLNEYATELANIINDLTNHVHRLRAWDSVLAGLNDTDKHEVSHEFIDTLGTVALGQPYAIKSRFAFAVGHLSHQANQAADGRDWKDEFPDKNLYLNDIEPYASQWKKYRQFKLKLERLAGKKFKQASDDFRNTYNHGFSSRFVVGMTAMVKREVIGGQVRYAFGGNDPLTVAEVVDLLAINATIAIARSRRSKRSSKNRLPRSSRSRVAARRRAADGHPTRPSPATSSPSRPRPAISCFAARRSARPSMLMARPTWPSASPMKARTRSGSCRCRGSAMG